MNRTICVMLYKEGRHKPFQVLQNDAARAPRCFLRQSLVAYQGVSVYGPKQANIVRSVVLAKFLTFRKFLRKCYGICVTDIDRWYLLSFPAETR